MAFEHRRVLCKVGVNIPAKRFLGLVAGDLTDRFEVEVLSDQIRGEEVSKSMVGCIDPEATIGRVQGLARFA